MRSRYCYSFAVIARQAQPSAIGPVVRGGSYEGAFGESPLYRGTAIRISDGAASTWPVGRCCALG